MATAPRHVGMKKAHEALYGKKCKVVSSVELARREWSSRNFQIHGLAAQIMHICDDLRVAPGLAGQVLKELVAYNNADGRAKGLNIT